MIITQKYNSAHDIDPEFIPDLESLLSYCVPSFDLIKEYEKNASEQTHFAYYLFFGDKHNAPIGYAQVQIEHPPEKSGGFLSKFISKAKRFAKLKWTIPGSTEEGFIFDPQYIQNASPEAQKIFKHYQDRDDVEEQQIVYSSAYQAMAELDFPAETSFSREQICDTLIKNKSSYENYFGSLPREAQVMIKQGWKRSHTQGENLGEFKVFKESFAYKKQGFVQYNELKKSPEIAKYLDLDCHKTFLTTSNEENVMNLVIFIEAKNGDCFYDILTFDENDYLCHQLAIMNFFETSHLNRLHYLGDKTKSIFLPELSFTQRDQFKLSVRKITQ